MGFQLNETSVIWGSSESGHKMADFLELMSRDQLNTLMIEAAVSSERIA